MYSLKKYSIFAAENNNNQFKITVMKKTLTLTVALLATFNLFAQDIIITSDAKRIEAKILEVSSSEIKYKEFNNLEGPTFILTNDELNTVIYQNGTVKTFEHTAKPAPQPVNNAGYNNYGYSNVPMATGLPITKSNDYYYMGDLRMDEDQYASFIKLNCKEAWDYYDSGISLWSTGWKCFGMGIGFTTAGAILLGVGVGAGTKYSYSGGYSYFDESTYLGCIIPGAILTATGGALLTACVPCLVIGGIRKNNSHEVYNEKCASQRQAKAVPMTFGFSASENGLGVALKF